MIGEIIISSGNGRYRDLIPFEVNLKDQVQFYLQDNSNWGGPACCQMAMNGYPPGATSCYVEQTEIWNYIQVNNQEGGNGPWGEGWYSDPYAVTKTLNDICPPEHHWVDVSKPDKYEVLYTLLRWMSNYNYPSLVCIRAHEKWALIVYFRTSDDPRQTTNPTLERIGYYDPEGIYISTPGDLWMENEWALPCNSQACGQIWNNKYVGVGEPPDEEGSVRVEIIPRVGKELIKPIEVTELAQKYLTELRREKSVFFLKRLTGVRAVEPMLVRELPRKEARKEIRGEIRYYIVPFVSRYEVDVTGVFRASVSVLVNAYTSRFEKLCVFSRPTRYLSEREVRLIARRTLRLSRSKVQRMEVELVSIGHALYVSSTLPAWRVAVADRTFFVTQSGLVLGGLYYPTYKGG